MNLAPIRLLPLVLISIPLLALGLWVLFKWLTSGAGVETAERKRILEMMESGKITSEEGTELLNAMGSSSALRGQEKFTRPDVVMLGGAALVILGFFLPWAYIGMRNMGGIFERASAYQAGYHAGAVGWAVFIIGVLAVVPVFVTPKDFLYKMSMMQIFLGLIGLVIVISLLVRAIDHLGAGLILCLLGFLLELIACFAKFKKLSA